MVWYFFQPSPRYIFLVPYGISKRRVFKTVIKSPGQTRVDKSLHSQIVTGIFQALNEQNIGLINFKKICMISRVIVNSVGIVDFNVPNMA